MARLSQILTLSPGGVILTGNPAGVGMGRTPPRYLQPGDTLTTIIEGLGMLHQQFTTPAQATA
ncbi:fumarylacetoacetate hydrolase family protein [Actinoplanes aureus]|uniref:fumarylacetoacetate hydrolase family protein n=1 Tax=Actinoplanes aureus TaxID=2792083 RepID=UPI00281629DE|nr:fumarylacetoacetate hydrolase family protein [Actinoplanes aureus]